MSGRTRGDVLRGVRNGRRGEEAREGRRGEGAHKEGRVEATR